jgi:hypothetical protein
MLLGLYFEERSQNCEKKLLTLSYRNRDEYFLPFAFL